MKNKEFFINAIHMIDVDGSTNIPTVLLYAPREVLIGSSALAAAKERHEINEDFKIDLGNIDPTSTAPRRKFDTASGVRKSAAELTGDFFHELLLYVNQWLTNT